MDDLLSDISDDVNRYLNLDELTMFSTVSTSTFYRGLNNMRYYRFVPNENGKEILRKVNYKIKSLDIKESSNINFANKYGQIPLHWAIRKGNIEIVKLLIKEGANVNYANNNVLPPLHWAVTDNNIEMVKLLIKEGADVNSINSYEKTPLYWAIRNNNTDIADLLRENGAHL